MYTKMQIMLLLLLHIKHTQANTYVHVEGFKHTVACDTYMLSHKFQKQLARKCIYNKLPDADAAHRLWGLMSKILADMP